MRRAINPRALKAAIASFRALLRAAPSAALVRRHVSSCTA